MNINHQQVRLLPLVHTGCKLCDLRVWSHHCSLLALQSWGRAQCSPAETNTHPAAAVCVLQVGDRYTHNKDKKSTIKQGTLKKGTEDQIKMI